MIEEKMRRCYADALGVQMDAITPESTVESLGGDSLDGIEVLMNVEQDFSLYLDDAEWDACVTFADHLALVAKTVGEAA